MASVALHKRKVLGAYRGVLCALRNHVMPSAYTGDVWVNAVSAEFRRHKHVRLPGKLGFFVFSFELRAVFHQFFLCLFARD
jgi:hypothetical protein